MSSQQTVITKKRGPKPTGVGLLIGVRLLPRPLADLDQWIARQSNRPSRPEAIRQLIIGALASEAPGATTDNKVAKQKPAPEKPE